MHRNLIQILTAAAALSLPYLCWSAPLEENPQAVEDCKLGLTAPPEVHFRRNAPVTATPMFSVTGDQRMHLFVTVRDADGNIVRQTVCRFDVNNNLVGIRQPSAAEQTQWVWE